MADSKPKAWWQFLEGGPTLVPALQVEGGTDKPSGLLDQEGNMLYRNKVTVGFLSDGKPRD